MRALLVENIAAGIRGVSLRLSNLCRAGETLMNALSAVVMPGPVSQKKVSGLTTRYQLSRT